MANEIYAFGTGGTVLDGDVMELATYDADPQRLNGHQLGIARRELMNMVLRQTSHMAAGLAQFIAGRYLPGVVDDGDLDKIVTGLTAAIVDIIENTPHDHYVSEILDLLNAAHTFTAAQRYAETTLAIDAGAVTWDCEAVPSAILLLDEDVISFTISGYQPGGSYDLSVFQAGDHTLALPAALYPEGGTGFEMPAAAGTRARIEIAPVTNPATAAVEPWYAATSGFAQVS